MGLLDCLHVSGAKVTPEFQPDEDDVTTVKVRKWPFPVFMARRLETEFQHAQEDFNNNKVMEMMTACSAASLFIFIITVANQTNGSYYFLIPTFLGVICWAGLRFLPAKHMKEFRYNLIVGIWVLATAATILTMLTTNHSLSGESAFVVVFLCLSCPAVLFALRFRVSLGLGTLTLAIYYAIRLTSAAKDSHLSEALMAICYALFVVFAFQREMEARTNFLAQKRLLHNQQKCRSLLQRMLPESIISKMDAGEKFIYQPYKKVSVLFSKIYHFDEYTTKYQPMQVVQMLNNLFTCFDDIVEDHKVFKVETVGPVYLISAGCPDEYIRPDHAAELVKVGNAMQCSLKAAKFIFQGVDYKPPVRIQIGVNTGEVICGVVGEKYPRYRLMGDTVNTSSRMSTTAGVGEIQLSASCYQELIHTGAHSDFDFEIRGPIKVKGKGMMMTMVFKKLRHDGKKGAMVTSESGNEDSPNGVDSQCTVADHPDDDSGTARDKRSVTGSAILDIEARTKALFGTLAAREDAECGSVGGLNNGNNGNNGKQPPYVQQTRKSAVQVSLTQNEGSQIFKIPHVMMEDLPWYLRLTQRFARHPKLERDFQSEFVKRNRIPNAIMCALLNTVMVIIPLIIKKVQTVDSNVYSNSNSRLEDTLNYVMLSLTVLLLVVQLLPVPSLIVIMQSVTAIIETTIICMTVVVQSLDQQLGDATTSAAMYDVSRPGVIVLFSVAYMSMFVRVQHWYTLMMFVVVFLTMLLTHTPTKNYLSVGFVVCGLFAYYYSSYARERRHRLDFVNYHLASINERRQQQFLDTMLPTEVTAEMMQTSNQLMNGEWKVIAHRRENASVLFCDIVSFTSMCAKMEAIDVVTLLNVIFTMFDDLSTRHTVYKVETIGDCYYACSGVITMSPTQTCSMVSMALDFQKCTSHLYSTTNERIMLRIGVHTGPVLAGVVGKKMPRYHLFGETVSLAEEMEQGGIPGAVVVSAKTHEAMQKEEPYDQFTFDPLENLIVLDQPHARFKVILKAK